jgi:hypothetical protein
MQNIPLGEILDQLPVEELETAITEFVDPIMERMPEKRLKKNVIKIVVGILGQKTPIVTGIARGTGKTGKGLWAMANRFYRFLRNDRFRNEDLLSGLYEIGQKSVAAANPEYLVVAIDPVNYEKPYTRKSEGVSTVFKSLPPDHRGRAHLAKGYPAITAGVVNTQVPVTTYANWFSYQTEDYLSDNFEIKASIETTCKLYPDWDIHFVGDAGLDDQKIFRWAHDTQQNFTIRACHLDRLVEVYNDRLDRWEPEEPLQVLVETVPFAVTFEVLFKRAGKTRIEKIRMGWLKIRLPDDHLELWVLVANNPSFDHNMVLLTNIPLENIHHVRRVYEDWRLRTRIEHAYRFHQDQGLDIENLRVRSLERMRRLFTLVLTAAQFVFSLAHVWPPRAVYWLRYLGGKLGLPSDRDGLYLVLHGISAVFQSAATFRFLANHPFPRDDLRCV